MHSFAHVGMTCQDPRATERFYSRHFGFKRARVVPLEGDKAVIFLKGANMYLELFAADRPRPNPPPTADGPHHPGLRHLAFRVDDVKKKLAEMGPEARVTLGPLSFDEVIHGWTSAWVADPDGNILEITQGYVDEDSPPPPAEDAVPMGASSARSPG